MSEERLNNLLKELQEFKREVISRLEKIEQEQKKMHERLHRVDTDGQIEEAFAKFRESIHQLFQSNKNKTDNQ